MTPSLTAELAIRVSRKSGSFEVRADLELDSGVLVLYGPSGVGKSLTLRALAGLVRPQEGHIRVFGKTLFDSSRDIHHPPHHRRLGYVPQHDSLFPFRNVAQNVAFGLPRVDRRPDHPRVAELMRELGLEKLADSEPTSLSGGELRRVALARALAVHPQLLLLDEPFNGIDHDARARLGRVVKETLGAHRVPAVLVTHDPREAVRLGDHLVRFERGRTVAAGAPEELLAAELDFD